MQKGVDDQNLYTVIFDFRGGTYLFQVYAKGEQLALEKWAKELDYDQVEHLGPKSKIELIEDIKDDGIDTPVTGLKNVWKTAILACGHFGLLYVIKTNNK